jgi:chitinase
MGGGGPNRWVMGYYAGYEASQLPVAEIQWSGLSHIAVSFYLPNGKGDVDESLFQDLASGKKLGHALVDAAHAAGKKAIASVGGGGVHDSMAASAAPGNRATFVARLKQLVTDYGYDGIDLDWEPIQSGDGAAIVALANDLRAAIPGTILTIPITPINHNAPDDLSYIPSLVAVFDQVNLMTYGMAGAYPGWKSWHSSPLYWNHDTSTPVGIDDSVAAFLAAGTPAAKLGVGSGFYGLCYTSPVTGPDQDLGGSNIVASDGTMSFRHIQEAYSPGSAVMDMTAHSPYLSFKSPHGPEGCTYVSYEDPQSIADKGQFVAQQNLGGLIIWTINQGHLPNAPAGQRDPMLDATRDAFSP